MKHRLSQILTTKLSFIGWPGQSQSGSTQWAATMREGEQHGRGAVKLDFDYQVRYKVHTQLPVVT